MTPLRALHRRLRLPQQAQYLRQRRDVAGNDFTQTHELSTSTKLKKTLQATSLRLSIRLNPTNCYLRNRSATFRASSSGFTSLRLAKTTIVKLSSGKR